MQGTEHNNTEPFDVIELPSKGLFYPNRIKSLGVSYLNAGDENILSSPNLMKNGQVFNVLLSRKIKDLGFDHRDLLIGDRNAIIIFLRSTGYGEIYPVKLTDPGTGDEFEYEFNLSELKYKTLIGEPDENGEFTFELPKTKKVIKFRLLTGRDEEDMLNILEKKSKTMGTMGISTALTMKLERQITEIDGNRDRGFIGQYVPTMLAMDSLSLRKKMEEVEPGIDLRVEVEAPSGTRFRTILPINPNFFWPNFGV